MRKTRIQHILAALFICTIISIAGYCSRATLSVYAQTNDGEVYVYENSNCESDIVCVLKEGYSYKVTHAGALWTEIMVDEDTIGYVATDSIEMIEEIELETDTDYDICIALSKIQAQYIKAENIAAAQSEYETEAYADIEKIKECVAEIKEYETVTTAVSEMSSDANECLEAANAYYEELKEGVVSLSDEEKQEKAAVISVQADMAETLCEEAADTAESKEAARQDIADYACSFAGILNYVSGGTSLVSGADCSGFTQAIYRAFGYSIPRTVKTQSTFGTSVSYSDIAVGDIVCFSGHVGIYIGNGKFVHSPGTGQKVKISTLSSYPESIKSIRRIIT